jgi:rubrerythrin
MTDTATQEERIAELRDEIDIYESEARWARASGEEAYGEGRRAAAREDWARAEECDGYAEHARKLLLEIEEPEEYAALLAERAAEAKAEHEARLARAREFLEKNGYTVRAPGEPGCRECNDEGGFFIGDPDKDPVVFPCDHCGKTASL